MFYSLINQDFTTILSDDFERINEFVEMIESNNCIIFEVEKKFSKTSNLLKDMIDVSKKVECTGAGGVNVKELRSFQKKSDHGETENILRILNFYSGVYHLHFAGEISESKVHPPVVAEVFFHSLDGWKSYTVNVMFCQKKAQEKLLEMELNVQGTTLSTDSLILVKMSRKRVPVIYFRKQAVTLAESIACVKLL